MNSSQIERQFSIEERSRSRLKVVIVCILALIVMNVEEWIMDLVYSFVPFCYCYYCKGQYNTDVYNEMDFWNQARRVEVRILWPIFNCLTALAMLYFFYSIGMKMIKLK